MEGEDGERVEGKGKWGKGNPGEVEGGEEQEKGDQKRFPLSSSPKLYDFFTLADLFLDASSHLYKPLYLSVRPYVYMYVRHNYQNEENRGS